LSQNSLRVLETRLALKGKIALVTFTLVTTLISSPQAFSAGKTAIVIKQAGRSPTSIPNTILSGNGIPAKTIGIDGDFFIDIKNANLYGPKTKGVWKLATSLRIPDVKEIVLPTPGIDGAKGNQGEQGLTGAAGTNGVDGIKGADGAKGATGASGIAITQLSICGASGTSLCKVGVQGPGGGTIFFVDYNDIYNGFNYLEAAPKACESTSKTWASALTAVTAAGGWAGRAVGAGPANTSAIQAVFATDTSANNAAYFATSCPAGGKSDWFLGSLGEMKLMYDNLQGVAGLAAISYWSSTEFDDLFTVTQGFGGGTQNVDVKTANYYVRPIRAF